MENIMITISASIHHQSVLDCYQVWAYISQLLWSGCNYIYFSWTNSGCINQYTWNNRVCWGFGTIALHNQATIQAFPLLPAKVAFRTKKLNQSICCGCWISDCIGFVHFNSCWSTNWTKGEEKCCSTTYFENPFYLFVCCKFFFLIVYKCIPFL